MKTWTFYCRTSNIRKRRVYDHILVPFKDKGNIKKSTVVRDTLHESDHGLVITDMQIPHIQTKARVSGSQTTRKLRSKQIAKQVEEKLKLSNKYEALEHLQNDEIQKSWTEFPQLIVEEAESPQNAEPRKPWIADATMNLIKNRASTKKLLLENEDKALLHLFCNLVAPQFPSGL